MKEIPLTKGFVALVDDEDYERLSKVPWHYSRGYAATSAKTNKFKSVFGDQIKTKFAAMHRIIMSAPAGVEVDHRKPTETLNNQKSNLRFADRFNNNHNTLKRKTPSTSRFKGVSWHTLAGKWHVQIRHQKMKIYIGLFDDEVVAAKAYDQEALRLHGDFSQLNFSKETHDLARIE